MYYLATVIVNTEEKSHKEQYLVDAVTFTEAEALCTKELRNYGIEGVITLSHKDAPFVGEIDPETKIYEVSIEEVEDLGLDKKGNPRSKTSKSKCYVAAHSLEEGIKSIDYGDVVGIKETKILGLIEP